MKNEPLIISHIECLIERLKVVRKLISDEEPKEEAKKFEIDGPGIYRMRNGLATLILRLETSSSVYPASGYYVTNSGRLARERWRKDGRFLSTRETEFDIVEKIRSL